ncbi:ABC transporter ATP-binding protein [Aquicoccus sp. SU-CL01552]|uniref:ABC transporter ATP-binding protein n=1 Tax=Aquicoccus sp. SU-CL01552 TaxID=3127656 RepID=UPI00310C7499
MTNALRLNSVSKSFGGFKALDAVDFSVAAGEVHALLGENGAGKSTLMNIACGLYAPDDGQIEMGGQPVTIAGARDAAAKGIGMVHQHFKLVPAFTVLENILLFNPGRPAEQVAQQALTLAQKIGFDIDLGTPAGALGISEQQRLEILKVLVAGARIVILDEPTAVLSEEDGQALMQLVRGLADTGSAVILVTHKLHEALYHSDRITVMRQGRKIAEARPGDMDPARLTELIVGEHIVEEPEPSPHVGGTRIRLDKVRMRGDRGRKGLVDVSFEVKDGEIYGIAGVSGNGQTELAEILMGLGRPDAGTIEIAGHGDVTHAGPAHRRRNGLACIPVDRYRHGLAGGITVADNYAINGALAGRYGNWLWFNRRRARSEARDAIRTFDVQGVRNLGQKAALLSGGNAQKLVIAREFEGQPDVVLAHSPSRGLDVRAGAAVHDRLRAARDRGAAVILISEDLDEVMLLSDRIGVLAGGRLSAEFKAPANRPEIGAAMVSHE